MLLLVEGCGVCLRGSSRSGKSTLALELVARGHRLVADDLIDWQCAQGRISGACPPQFAGFIEVCGLGVLNLGALYGPGALAPSALLDLVLELDSPPAEDEVLRLHGGRDVCSVLGVPVPRLRLPRAAGASLAVLVEAACRDQRLRSTGYRADEDLVQRQRSVLEQPPHT